MAPTAKGNTPTQEQVDALKAQVMTSLTLTKRLYGALSEIMTPSSSQFIKTPNKTHINDPVQLIHQSASLIKAHSTKLGLLMITEPFTPSAIIRVIAELVNTPVLTIVSGAQALDGTHYTKIFRQHMVARCAAVVRLLVTLLDMVPNDGKALQPDNFTTTQGSLVATSKLISACDDAMGYASNGVNKYLIAKVEEWRDTLDDELKELREWGQQSKAEDRSGQGDGGQGSASNPFASKDYHSALDSITQGITDSYLGEDPQALLDCLTEAPPIPMNDPKGIRPRLNLCLNKLAQLKKLYNGIIDQRLKHLPQLPTPTKTNIPARVDEVLVLLRKIPDMIGDLAEAFYQHDPAEIDRKQDQYLLNSLAVLDLIVMNWQGQKDSFGAVYLRDMREGLKTEV